MALEIGEAEQFQDGLALCSACSGLLRYVTKTGTGGAIDYDYKLKPPVTPRPKATKSTIARLCAAGVKGFCYVPAPHERDARILQSVAARSCHKRPALPFPTIS